MTQSDFQAVSSTGAVLRTFSDKELAKRWVFRHARQWPGLRVEEVIVTVMRRKVYQPRQMQVAA